MCKNEHRFASPCGVVERAVGVARRRFQVGVGVVYWNWGDAAFGQEKRPSKTKKLPPRAESGLQSEPPSESESGDDGWWMVHRAPHRRAYSTMMLMVGRALAGGAVAALCACSV